MDPKAADNLNLLRLGLAALAAGFILTSLPWIYVGLPVAALALGWITYRNGWLASSAVALFAAVLVAAVGPRLGLDRMDAGFVGVALLAVGPGTAMAIRRYSPGSVVFAVGLVLAAVFFVSPAGTNALTGLMADMRTVFSTGVFNPQGADRQQIAQLSEQFAQYVALVWPAIAFGLMGLCALITVPLVAIMGRRQGVEVRRFTPLAEMDASFHLVWPTIAGLALLAAGTYVAHGKGWMIAVGLNALLIVRPALVAQGLGDFAALYRRLHLGRIARGIGYTSLLLAESILPSTSVLGLVDLFFNLRRLPRGEPTPPATGDI